MNACACACAHVKLVSRFFSPKIWHTFDIEKRLVFPNTGSTFSVFNIAFLCSKPRTTAQNLELNQWFVHRIWIFRMELISYGYEPYNFRSTTIFIIQNHIFSSRNLILAKNVHKSLFDHPSIHCEFDLSEYLSKGQWGTQIE